MTAQTLSTQKALVLMYHRIQELESDPWGLAVSSKHFEEQLQVLRMFYRTIPLRELVQALHRGEEPGGAIVLTFDDGYADNFQNGSPLLLRYDVPATFFLVSGYLNRQREFWWDELDRIFLQTVHLPEVLSIDIAGKRNHFHLIKPNQQNSNDAQGQWRAWEPARTSRQSVYYSVWEQLRPLGEFERREKLNELRSWARKSEAGRSSHRTLTSEEVRALLSQKNFELACHTVMHPRLSALTVKEQQDEILQSKAAIEEMIGGLVDNFAYPYGGKEDYTQESISLVQQAGFASACSTIPGYVTRNSDLYQLPRVQVQDWDGDEFAQQIFRWQTSFDESRN